MEADLVINRTLTIPGAELDLSYSRSSGPGGQHVNKTSSKVSLRWSVAESASLTDRQRAMLLARLHARLVGEGELLINVESERSQVKNRQIARERLAEIVEKALRPTKSRVATKPTKGSQIRRVEDKKKHGLVKKMRRAGFDT